MQLNIHAQNLNISEQLKEEFGQRIKGIFDRTQQKIRKVRVIFTDVNGPKGGEDKQCRVQLVLFGLPTVNVVSKQANLHKALAHALSVAKRTLKRRYNKLQRVDHVSVRQLSHGELDFIFDQSGVSNV
ncbi:HPF/RaiA family ribosome-associated protein [Paraglaciecola sp. 25GB23A]|jgi:putative sigma-54 modulation protein|uniref:HPF/RaiA family ribosome-associated protein n=1 Tax=Paraglaciecola sp. 25GB23A TaxID=3156068 RepID=UPI0032B022DD|tara:strand:- start:518 stop:901 length:384 start_codon:yes stop_codon:yes gene_type:complete